MNMKKLVSFILTLAFTITLFAGCKPNNGQQPENTVGGSAQQGAPIEQGEPDMKSNESDDLSGEILFGRVKSIVGNEIELELAELSGGEDMGEGAGGQSEEGQSFAQDNYGDEGEGGGGPSLSIVKDGKQYRFGADASDDGMDLTYIGETRSIIIPAGAEIQSLLGDATLSAIRKGSILQVTLLKYPDSVAEKVMIME